MCVDICVDMCVALCVRMHVHMCVDMCVDTCAALCVGMFVDMCAYADGYVMTYWPSRIFGPRGTMPYPGVDQLVHADPPTIDLDLPPRHGTAIWIDRSPYACPIPHVYSHLNTHASTCTYCSTVGPSLSRHRTTGQAMHVSIHMSIHMHMHTTPAPHTCLYIVVPQAAR